MSTTSTRLGAVPMWMSPLLAVAGATVLICFALGFLRFPRITATAQTLSIGGYLAREAADWNAIESIDAVLHRNNVGVSLRLSGNAKVDVEVYTPSLFGPRPDQTIKVPVDLYPAGAVPLLDLLRFYLEHPDDRVELDDGRAYERLCAMTQ